MPMSRELVDWLTERACFAADTVAMECTSQGITGHQRTKAVVERTIEFLVGNGLLIPADLKSLPEWIKMDPPYDETKIEAKK